MKIEKLFLKFIYNSQGNLKKKKRWRTIRYEDMYEATVIKTKYFDPSIARQTDHWGRKVQKQIHLHRYRYLIHDVTTAEW